jgi:hypothetical protein
MAALKLFNVLALASVALLALQSGPTSVNALTTNRAHVARYVGGHEAVAVAKRKRDTSSSSGNCKPKPTTSATMSSSYGSSSVSMASTYGDNGTPTSSSADSVPYTPAPSSSSSSTYSSLTPSSTPTPASTGSSNGKKWGLAWPNGDANYLSTFAARPNVGLCVIEIPSCHFI